jgi:hypothetical protein
MEVLVSEMVSKLGFEMMTCSRCGGSGNYSYCQMYGSVCFKCHGKKVCYTAKGFVAASYYTESLKVPASELVVGDLVQVDDFFKGKIYFAPITEIKPSTSMRKLPDGSWASIGIEISTEHAKYGESGFHCSPESMVRKGWSAEFKAAKQAEALAYQATLTKAGKPRKAAAKAAA